MAQPSQRTIDQTLKRIEGWLDSITDLNRRTYLGEDLRQIAENIDEGLPIARPGCARFEALPIEARVPVGNAFTDGAVTARVRPFQLGDGTWFSGGFAEVESGMRAGGSGQEIEVNNVNLSFAFGGWASNVTKIDLIDYLSGRLK